MNAVIIRRCAREVCVSLVNSEAPPNPLKPKLNPPETPLHWAERRRLDWAPVLRQPVKTQFSLNGKESHEPAAKIIHQRVQGSRCEAVGAGCIHCRGGAGV